MKKILLIFAMLFSFATSVAQTSDLQTTLSNGKIYETSSTDQDAYMKFTTTTGIDANMKLGYDGIILGSKYNSNGYEFANLQKTGLIFGNNYTSVRLLRNINQPVNTQINAFLPANTGTVATIRTDAPASLTATGFIGEIRVTTAYLYVCVAVDTWVRFAAQ